MGSAMTAIMSFGSLFFIMNVSGNCFELQFTTDLFTNLSYRACVHNRFCNSENISALTPGHYSCCADCSCSQDCYIGNRCCPDANVKNLDLKCKHQQEYFDVHRGIDISPAGESYYAIDSCKNDQDGTANRCLQPKTLDDHILVSDPSTLLVYKNAKCAQCNGISKYLTWKLLMFCPYGENIFSVENRNKYILDKCSLVSKPPNYSGQKYKKLRCSPDVIETCNVTKEWDFYSKELEKGCASYSMIYKEELLTPSNIVLNSRIFKNVYCYMCNKKKGTVFNPKCYQQVDVKAQRVYNDEVEFSANYMYIPFRIQSRMRYSCKVDEYADSFTETCRRLYCPFGETAMYGSCIKLTKDISMTLSALYALNISSSYLDARDLGQNKELFYYIVEGIQAITRRFSCNICDISLYSDNIFMLRFVPGTCSMQKVLSLFDHISKTSIPIETSAFGEIVITLIQTNRYIEQIYKENRFSLTINGLKKVHSIQKRICLVGTTLKTKFHCESIVFPVSEIHSKEVLGKLLVASDPYHYNNNSVEDYMICLSDYKRITNTASGYTRMYTCLYLLVSISILIIDKAVNID